MFFLKCAAREMSIQQIATMVLDDATIKDVPVLAFPTIRVDIIAQLVPRQSSIQPEIDPFTGMSRSPCGTGSKVPADYPELCLAISKGIMNGDFSEMAVDDRFFSSANKPLSPALARNFPERPAPDFVCFIMASFHNVYVHHNETPPIEKDSVDGFYYLVRGAQWNALPEQVRVGQQIVQHMVCSSFKRGSFFDTKHTRTMEEALMLRAVLHLAAVLCTVDPESSPFFSLMAFAGAHQETYLPSLPEDEFAEIMKTQGDVGAPL